MTVAEREIKLMSEVRDLVDFYCACGNKSVVSIFAEDYDFLLKRKKIFQAVDAAHLGGIQVSRGPRKKKVSRKRPSEFWGG